MRKLKVLIVDDVLSFLVLKEILEKEFDCKTTKDPKKALELIKKEHFDVLITDYETPYMKGDELIHKLSDVDNQVQVVLLISNYEEEVIKKYSKLMDLISYDYIPKPLSVDKINIIIEKLRNIKV
jgi:DNA-binding NtrC family response regulator